MNKQLAKNIRKYVKIKMKEEALPEEDEKRIYKVFKGTYENASPEDQKKYDQNMEDKFKEVKLTANWHSYKIPSIVVIDESLSTRYRSDYALIERK